MKNLYLGLALMWGASTPISATGIPVVDIAAMTQLVTNSAARAQEFAKSIDQARSRLAALKAQTDQTAALLSGHYAFEDLLKNTTPNPWVDMSALQNLAETIGDISHLREQFGLSSDNPMTQQRYDAQLKQYKLQQTLYQQSVARNQNMSRLLSQFSSADTPSAKADLANAIAFEKVQIQNDQQVMRTVSQMLAAQDRLAAEQQLDQAYQAVMFGDGIPY